MDKDKTRKLIDLEKKVIKKLKIKSVNKGAKSVKNYIEDVLTVHANS